MLAYEGEYKNGKRNGKGKEYNVKFIIYEGQSLNGKRIIYEGEYLNGKRNGKGKEYYVPSAKILFDGEYLNNRRINGTKYDENGNITCELKNNKRIL